MKGISAVIAVILLLLITIAVVGAASGFFGRITSIAGQSAENQTSEQITRLSKQVTIDSSNSTSASIRNSGTSTLSAGEIALYVNGAPRTCSPALSSLSPGAVQTCNFSPPCTQGQRIRVTTPGGSAEVNC